VVVLIVLSQQITQRAALAEAFGQTFWWVLAFAAAAVVSALLLPGRKR
jgi:hypothetical protein